MMNDYDYLNLICEDNNTNFCDICKIPEISSKINKKVHITKFNYLTNCSNCDKKCCEECGDFTECILCNKSYCKNCNYNPIIKYDENENKILCINCHDDSDSDSDSDSYNSSDYGFTMELIDTSFSNKILHKHRINCNLWDCSFKNCGGRKKNGNLNELSLYE